MLKHHYKEDYRMLKSKQQERIILEEIKTLEKEYRTADHELTPKGSHLVYIKL